MRLSKRLIIISLVLSGLPFLLFVLGRSRVERDSFSEQYPTLRELEKGGDLPISDYGCYTSIQFVDDKNGWYLCRGQLWKTADGGKKWQRVYQDENSRYSNSLFIDSRTGWIYSLSSLQETTDGGETWTRKTLPFSEGAGRIQSLVFLPDGKRGWLTGGVYRKYPASVLDHLDQSSLGSEGKAICGVIFYTEDGGETWQPQEFKSLHARLVQSGSPLTYSFAGQLL